MDSVTTFDCVCPVNNIIVERNSSGQLTPSKTCVACPAGQVVISSVSRYQCQACPYPTVQYFDASNVCQCIAGYTAVRDMGLCCLFWLVRLAVIGGLMVVPLHRPEPNVC